MLALDIADADAARALCDGGSAAAWLRAHGLRADIGAEGLESLRGLRAAVDRLLRAAATGGQPPAGALDELNARSAEAAVCPQLNWPADGRPRMWLSTPAGGDAAALGAVARSAIDLLSGPDRARLRVCDAHGCDRLFLATTPRRRWCSAACGNRVRVARHAARYRLR
jgi:predicted RNA-binding Zn ribbon-like protein